VFLQSLPLCMKRVGEVLLQSATRRSFSLSISVATKEKRKWVNDKFRRRGAQLWAVTEKSNDEEKTNILPGCHCA